MKQWIPLCVAMMAGFGIAMLFQSQPEQIVERRVPIEKKIDAEALANAMAFLNGSLTKGTAIPAESTAYWPHFRGKDRDGIVQETVPLARKWPDSGPKVLWQRAVAKGHASVVVQNGCMYLHDYDSDKNMDVVRCMSLDTGEDIWSYSYPVKIKTSHGITRCVPAVNKDYLVTFGPKCHISCFKPDTGERLWAKSLVIDYQTKVPTWYAGQCPILENGRVILAPSGPEKLMVALDVATGEEIWSTPNPEGWDMTHTSIAAMTIDGKKMYVYSASGGVAGVDAESGALLWLTKEWKIKIAAIATPIHVGDGRIFLSAGYGVGAMMIQVKKAGDSWQVDKEYALEPEQFGSAQQTPIFYKNCLFGVLPKPTEAAVCMNLDGTLRWTSTASHSFGIGPYLIADGLLFLMDDHGHMTLAEASIDEFKILSQATVLEDSHDSWGPMVLVDGKLIIRDLEQMACLDVSADAY